MNNFRDFGYKNIKKGMLFRGSELSEISEEDKNLLFIRNDIKVVIDLRSTQEVEDKKDITFPGVKIFNIPLLTIEEMSDTVQDQFPNVLSCYKNAVSKGKKNVWSTIFKVLLENENGAVMFHCTQGKDRTGIVVAIVLYALGIDKDTIYQDYLLTNKYVSMPDEYRSYLEMMPSETAKLFKGLFFVDKDFLKESFLEIDRQYGSIDKFFKECCSLDKNDLLLLKSKYLE